MHQMTKTTLLLILAIAIQSCAQEKETFWKADVVKKIDNTPFNGITVAYMDMIAEMKIHLSVNNDSIIIGYPFDKKLKISEFKSFTNCKIPSTGQLLDSIYDIDISGDDLKIKFYYTGTADDEKRFSLNFVKLNKDVFFNEIKSLNESKLKILKQINTLDLSSLDLPEKPGYLSNTTKLSQLNPMLLAEQLVDNKNSFQILAKTFSLSKDKNQLTYQNVEIENSDKIEKNIAQINAIKFNTISFVSREKTSKADAVVVSKNKMSSDEIAALYDFISSHVEANNIEQFGLPRLYAEGDSLGIHNFLAITWKLKDKVIKLAIEDVPDELWDKEIDGNIALRDNYAPKDIEKVFRHYLPLIGTSDIKLFIVSNDLNNTLYLKENNPGSKSWGIMYDYTFKWRYLSEID